VPELRPYQEVSRSFLAGRRFALLADEMRLGKTPPTIVAARDIGAVRILVICPAIAVAQWVRELKRWGGYDAQTAGFGDPQHQVFVTSFDKAVTHREMLTARQWDVLAVDEVHYCKTPSAKRTQAVFGNKGLVRGAWFVWALSGTPAPNHVAELYPLLKTFGAVKCSYSTFVSAYCWVDAQTFKPKGTKASKVPELRELLAKVMLRRKRKEVAPDMPEIGFEFLPVKPDLTGIDALMLGNASAVPEETKAQLSILANFLREPDAAAQITERAGDFNLARQYSALAKVSSLADEITFNLAASLYKQTVVFGFYVRPLHMVASLLVARGIKAEIINGSTPPEKRERYQDMFRRGTLPVLLCQIIAAGTAIDLSSADHGYFLELDWVPGNNMQAAHRLVSMTKATPVTYDIVTWPGSPDEAVQRTLARKVAELSQLL
jgi:SWI/SNF-related matrix-associated actin-dependent regulator 1 of chromatin subfamily A